MTRLYVSVLALAMLAALLSGCGGGEKEEAVSLAVAFRLDEGFPVMVAYVGDPAEDPWQLPAGRYYIEALDQDDVLLSLGAVDIEDGDVVDFPPSFAAAGGVADPQRAQPLFTLTSFLVDLELAKYKLLEIVTAGFTESPFGSAVEPDDASVQQLFAMYGDIAAQEDAVLAALSQIESRLAVSSGASYVCSSWAFAPDDLDRTELQVAFFVALLIRAQQMGEAADSPGEACGEGACWVIPLQGECFGVDSPQQRLTKTPEMLAMFNKWQEYAGKLVQDLGLTPDKASPGQARKELREKVNSDLKQRWGSDTPPYVIDQVADFFVNELAKVVPELASVPAPGPGQAKPDTSWIEGFAQKVADRLLDQGHSGLDVAVWADDLRHCLTQYVEQGLSQEDAAAVCVWLVEGFIVQRLEPTSEEPAEPEPEEPTEPEPEEPTEPEPEEPTEPEPEEPAEPEPEEPTEPEPENVTAVGQYTRAQSPGYVVVKNTMTLTFNTAGGLVEGDGEKDVQTPDDQGCGTGMIYGTYEYEGTYYPETKTFDGTFTVVGDGYFMSRSSDCDFVDDELVCECKSVPWGDTFSGDWQAALEDGVVQGSQTVQVDTFELTVQG